MSNISFLEDEAAVVGNFLFKMDKDLLDVHPEGIPKIEGINI